MVPQGEVYFTEVKVPGEVRGLGVVPSHPQVNEV